MRFVIVAVVAFTICFQSRAQHLAYAKEIVKELSSEAFQGRGYVGKGDKKAAQFIAEEFQKNGIESFEEGYVQHFTTPVNTFPDQMKLSVNGVSLAPGRDFLIDPGSPGISGKFKTVSLSADDLLDEQVWIKKVQAATKKFIVIESYDKNTYNKEQLNKINEIVDFLKYHPDNPAVGTLVITTDKLTWSGSTQQFDQPSLIVKGDVLKGKVKTIEVDINSEFHSNYETQNVMGYVEGVDKDTMIVFVAHYDHLGMMGSEALFPGANDNASGVAMLLSLAKHYAQNTPDYTIAFIAFGAEELGLLGSRYFIENPVFALDKIKFLINFDISGTGDEGIQVVNGSIHQAQFDRISRINEEQSLLPQVKIRGEACNSDHCFFHRDGVPCFYIYTLGGIQAYHDINDKYETLPLTAFNNYFKLLTTFVEGL